MNKNFWDLYKNSDRGKETIALFTFNSEKDDLEKKAKEVFKKYHEYLGGIADEDYFLDRCFSIIDNIIADSLFIEEDENATDYFIRLIDSLEICFVEEHDEGKLVKAQNERPIIVQKDYKKFCAILSEISLILYFYGDKFFFPIFFRVQFDVFIKILDVLGIPMPRLPAKADVRGRLLLYNDLCTVITKFGKENSLTSEETCACIYDFSFMLLDESNTHIEIPEPTNIWLTGGSKYDYKAFLENPIDGAKSVWACNENTKRGDIIVMYVCSPYSCIQSIWIADIDGVYNPV